MARHVHTKAGRAVPVLPWVLLLLWVCVIWGHSFMPGSESSSESSLVLGLVRRAGAWLFSQGFPPVQRLLDAHPGIMRVFANTDLLHHYVRKAGHFCEYFVLGILAFNAVRLTFTHPIACAAAFGVIWVGVPNIDETIQRFVPGRAGMMQDVLLDMSGFGCGFVLCLLVFIVGALLSAVARLFSGGHRA